MSGLHFMFGCEVFIVPRSWCAGAAYVSYRIVIRRVAIVVLCGRHRTVELRSSRARASTTRSPRSRHLSPVPLPWRCTSARWRSSTAFPSCCTRTTAPRSCCRGLTACSRLMRSVLTWESCQLTLGMDARQGSVVE